MDRLPAEFLKQWIEKENRRLKMWAEQPPMSPEGNNKLFFFIIFFFNFLIR